MSTESQRALGRTRTARWRVNNPERHRVIVRQTHVLRRTIMMQHLEWLKTTTPCADCELFFPHYVMEFDHVRGRKLFNLSTGSPSWVQFETELKKCDVVCGNCHNTRTYKRRMLANAETLNHNLSDDNK